MTPTGAVLRHRADPGRAVVELDPIDPTTTGPPTTPVPCSPTSTSVRSRTRPWSGSPTRCACRCTCSTCPSCTPCANALDRRGAGRRDRHQAADRHRRDRGRADPPRARPPGRPRGRTARPRAAPVAQPGGVRRRLGRRLHAARSAPSDATPTAPGSPCAVPAQLRPLQAAVRAVDPHFDVEVDGRPPTVWTAPWSAARRAGPGVRRGGGDPVQHGRVVRVRAAPVAADHARLRWRRRHGSGRTRSRFRIFGRVDTEGIDDDVRHAVRLPGAGSRRAGPPRALRAGARAVGVRRRARPGRADALRAPRLRRRLPAQPADRGGRRCRADEADPDHRVGAAGQPVRAAQARRGHLRARPPQRRAGRASPSGSATAARSTTSSTSPGRPAAPTSRRRSSCSSRCGRAARSSTTAAP